MTRKRRKAERLNMTATWHYAPNGAEAETTQDERMRCLKDLSARALQRAAFAIELGRALGGRHE